MPKMRVAQVGKPGGPLEIVERDIPEPAAGHVRIRVHACGICHSDSITKEGYFAGIAYPRVPGHEVVGVVDALGTGVTQWTLGQLVGVGWHGGFCGKCNPCRHGELFACETQQITGISFDGGYGEYMVAPASAVAQLPEGLTAIEAAPLMCAGLTTYNALRNSGARGGDIVAVLGLGGLGHLGVQYAAKMGFHTVAIARGKDKEPLAKKLGAHHYIDSQTEKPAEALQKLGGAQVVLATVTDGDAMAATIGGLAIKGRLMVLGAAGTVPVAPLALIMGKREIRGWYSGTSIDSQETLAFSKLADVRSMNEVYSLDQVAAAYEHMISGKARFRVVLKMG